MTRDESSRGVEVKGYVERSLLRRARGDRRSTATRARVKEGSPLSALLLPPVSSRDGEAVSRTLAESGCFRISLI